MAFRETHPAIFDCTDIYFLCLCSCSNSKQQKINLEIDNELMESKWFTKDEIIKEMKNIIDQKIIKFMLDLFPDQIEKYKMTKEEFKFFGTLNMILYRPKF